MSKDPVTVIGVLMEAGVPTVNGRVYTEEALKAAVEQFKKRKHPLYGTTTPMDVVRMAEVSHEVTNLSLEEKSLMATVSVLDTPKGSELRRMLENPETKDMFNRYGRLVPSGIGSTHKDENGRDVVNDYLLRSISFEFKEQK